MRTLDQISLTPGDQAAIRTAAEALRDALPIERVILFGSRARGDASQQSDFDLLVLTSGPVDAALRRKAIDLLYPLELQRDKWFGLMLVSNHEWQEGVYQAMPIRQEIDRDGIDL